MVKETNRNVSVDIFYSIMAILFLIEPIWKGWLFQ